MLRAVLFDLDDTLLDRQASLALFVSRQAHERLGLPGARARRYVDRFLELDDHGRHWIKAVYRSLYEELPLGAWTPEQLLADYERHLPACSLPKDGALGALEAIQSMGLQLGLVSNGKAALQERKLRAIGIAPLFDARVFPGAVGRRKPDRAIFHFACARLNRPPNQCVFVGDNPRTDIDGAVSAGLHSVYLPVHQGERCARADAHCTRLRDLPAVIAAMQSPGAGRRARGRVPAALER